MTVLVTGSTGTVGAEVVRQLVSRGVDVRALSRTPEKAQFPEGVTAVAGELTDPDAMRAALDEVSGLFLLSAVTADELTGTLITLSPARAAGVRDVVYLSTLYADVFTDAPHLVAKGAAERTIRGLGLSATILRPTYFVQKDAAMREIILSGTYPPPVGNRAVLMVDARDVGEIAARCLVERQEAEAPLPTEVIDIADPETYTADAVAGLWSQALGREVVYGGDDLDAFEQATSQHMPGFFAYDLRLMMGHFQDEGLVAAPGTDQRLREILGRPPRSYRTFVTETAAAWAS